MNNLTPAVFQFDNLPIRTIVFEGDPWFIAKDVAEALGYKNTRDAISKHCKRKSTVAIHDGSPTNPVILTGLETCPLESGGQVRHMTIIPEGDVYRLCAKSELPSAERFESWVFDEVLPSIRKTGSYQLHPETPATLTTPAKEFRAVYGIARLIGMEKNKAALSANQATIKTTGVDMLDMMGAKKMIAEKQVRYFTPSQLGERLGLSGQAFNKKLAELGLQEKHNNEWCPTGKGEQYSCLVDTGKRHNGGKAITQLHWYEDVMAILEMAGGAQ